MARAAFAELIRRGWDVSLRREPLVDDVAAVADQLANDLTSAAHRVDAGTGAQRRRAIVAYGEPTVRLPPDAEQGGRAQQLALLLARRLAGGAAAALIAGTDGVDGPTQPPVAGAIIDGRTWAALDAAGIDAAGALARCDARPALAAVGALLATGPTGLNHADVMILLWPGS